jgi:16S rRNA (uracil1498-N3)-methyltransferase
MKILQEAAEQCGRADIPTVCEPRTVQQLVLDQALHWQFVVLEKGGWSLSSVRFQSPLALLVGPEGGWSERELALFSDQQIPKISISQFTLRAETAAVAGATILGQLLDAPFD